MKSVNVAANPKESLGQLQMLTALLFNSGQLNAVSLTIRLFPLE